MAASLACLAHPFVVASAVLLLANDHYLKSASPSWLTGKLSDFSGIVVFAFLMTLLVASALRATGRPGSAGLVGGFGFCAAALVFTVFKLTGGAALAPVYRLLAPGPVAAVRDPTDLVCFLALIPAWRLWRRQAGGSARSGECETVAGRARQPQAHVTARHVAAVGLAALATMATSPPHRQFVDFLVVSAADVYALEASPHEPDQPSRNQCRVLAASSDGGLTWQSQEPDPALQRRLCSTERPEPTGLVCAAPPDDSLCFRAEPLDGLQISRDAGATWTPLWRARTRFQHRTSTMFPPDNKVFDLVVVPTDRGPALVAAVGEQGVVVREPGGRVRRVAVGEARPRPDSARESMTLAIATAVEWVFATVVGTLAAANVQRKRPRVAGGRPRIWLTLVMLTPLAALAVPFSDVLALGMGMTLGGPVVLTVLFALVALYRAPRAPDRRFSAPSAAFGAVFLAAYLPFAAWAVGFPQSYEPALALSIACTAVALYIAARPS